MCVRTVSATATAPFLRFPLLIQYSYGATTAVTTAVVDRFTLNRVVCYNAIYRLILQAMTLH